jgi:hypothetical protein
MLIFGFANSLGERNGLEFEMALMTFFIFFKLCIFVEAFSFDYDSPANFVLSFLLEGILQFKLIFGLSLLFEQVNNADQSIFRH